MLNAIKYFITVVDILVVAFILYKAFMLIRGTRAIQVIKGLGILIFVSSIASLGRLETLDWLLQKFWTWGVVGFIVIFAPELKRALARMGRVAAFFGGNLTDESKDIREVVDAAERLALIHAGALIVMGREASLEEVVESGVPIDSKVSRQLLMTIFYPDTELHDGAVIITNGRIVAASCTLPLSQNPRWEEKLGTRHRAAIGITEETDAIVIIVSEESGVISVAMEGEITRYLEPQTLYKILIDFLTPSSEDKKVIKKVTVDESKQIAK